MNERKVLDYTGWRRRIENVGVNTPWSLENLLELDDRILDMQERLQGTDIGSFEYESLASDMRESMQGIDVLYRYATDTERAIDEMDTAFMTALSKGAVEDLSLIRMDDITVDNTIGMKETYMVGYGDSRCAVERTKDKLTLNDFIGGNGAGCMTGYVKEFADLFRNQYLEAGGKEENFSEYLEELYTMGEFDHKKYQPVKTFLSDILDVVTLGVKPLLEGLFQYEFITGETLTDTESLFKVVEGVVGLITVGTGSYGKGVAVIAQELLAEVTANVTVEGITQLGEELGLPPIVTAILALAGGVAAGKAVNGCFVDEDQLLKQIDVEKLQLEGDSESGLDVSLLDDMGKFANDTLENNYQVYINRKIKKGQIPKDRLEWKKASDYWTKESPIARGNNFNKTVREADIYDYHEIYLENGKRVDSYDPDVGEIISRKATDLDKITEETYRGYLSEFSKKYSEGTKIRSNAYPELDGTELKGEYVLEIPANNANISNIDYYKQIAAEYDVILRFTEEVQ